MSVTEMKNKLLEEISMLNDEKALSEILEHLQHLSSGNKVINLSKHFDEADNQFNEALKKMAQ